MKRNTTLLAYVLTLTFSFQQAIAQNDGDYRSNLTSGILWTTVANWQVYDGVVLNDWTAAAHYPTAADGVITIRGTDSLTLNGVSISIDQVVVTTSAKLSLFGGTFTLNDVAGDDMTIDGHVFIGNTGFLTGAGSILVNSSGWIVVRNSGRLQVASTVNNGYGETSGNAFIENGTFTNNTLFNWVGNTNTAVALNNNAVFDNNGTFRILGTGTRSINSGTANGIFSNNTGGLIDNNGGNDFSVGNVTFNNAGDIQATGTNTFSNTNINTGSITPGGPSAGRLRVNGGFINNKAVTINIQVLNAPNAGTDTLEITSAVNVALNAASLAVVDYPASTIGTYEVIQVVAGQLGSLTGTFASATLPANYSPAPTYAAKSVTVEKLTALPLTWGSFTARQNNGRIALNWTTLQEINVSHFVVEHSTDGKKFNAIGTVSAKGNSNDKQSYSFEHSNPQHNGRNFYRILEIDLDAKSAYSVIRSIKLGDNNSAAVSIRSNPVQNGILLLESDLTNTSAFITGINGAVLQEIRLHQGINNVNVSSLPTGVYTINVFDSKSRIFSGRFVKK